MSARASFGRSLAEDLHIYFVDQGCGLEGVIGTLPPQLIGGHPAKVCIQDCEQALFRGTVAILNPPKQLRYFTRICDHLLFSEDTSFTSIPEIPER